MKTTLALCVLLCAFACGASAEPVPPVPPTPQALPPLGSAPLRRHITFKAMVDAEDDIVVQNGELHIEHQSWSKPLDISINGKKWNPTWTHDTTNKFANFGGALAPFAGTTVKLVQIKGRGESYIREQPTEANGWRLVVRVHDSGLGASAFEVHIDW